MRDTDPDFPNKRSELKLSSIYILHTYPINIVLLGFGSYSRLVSYCWCDKFHKLGALKTHKFILLQFWRPEVWRIHGAKTKVSARTLLLPEILGENSCLAFSNQELHSLPFSASSVWLYSLAHDLFLQLQNPKHLQIFLSLPRSPHCLFSSVRVKTAPSCLPLISLHVIALGLP